jgi:hypothetical protein
MRCCQNATTCLIERARAMKLNGPYGWGIKCMDCVEGCARQMDKHVPEPDVHDTQSPIAVAKRVARPADVCSTCGKKITRGAKQCKPCRGKERTAAMPGKCTHPGCRWKARRGGLCHSHSWASRPAPYHRGKETTP